MSNQYVVDLNKPFKEAGWKRQIFGRSQSQLMLQEKIDSLENNIRILTEENKSLHEQVERHNMQSLLKKVKLEMKEDEVTKLETENKEQKQANSKLISQLRSERADHDRKLQETIKIIEEEMNKKMEDAMDEATDLYELTKFQSLVLAEKLNAYKYAYNEVGFLLDAIIGYKGKLRELAQSVNGVMLKRSGGKYFFRVQHAKLRVGDTISLGDARGLWVGEEHEERVEEDSVHAYKFRVEYR